MTYQQSFLETRHSVFRRYFVICRRDCVLTRARARAHRHVACSSRVIVIQGKIISPCLQVPLDEHVPMEIMEGHGLKIGKVLASGRVCKAAALVGKSNLNFHESYRYSSSRRQMLGVYNFDGIIKPSNLLHKTHLKTSNIRFEIVNSKPSLPFFQKIFDLWSYFRRLPRPPNGCVKLARARPFLQQAVHRGLQLPRVARRARASGLWCRCSPLDRPTDADGRHRDDGRRKSNARNRRRPPRSLGQTTTIREEDQHQEQPPNKQRPRTDVMLRAMNEGRGCAVQ